MRATLAQLQYPGRLRKERQAWNERNGVLGIVLNFIFLLNGAGHVCFAYHKYFRIAWEGMEGRYGMTWKWGAEVSSYGLNIVMTG
jgi:hypothetical protein